MTTATTASLPPAGGVTVDDARALELPLDTCFWLIDQPGQRLVDGAIQLPDRASIRLSETDSVFADFTGDGVDDALLMLNCDGGGVHVWNSLVAVIANGPTFAVDGANVLDPSGLPAGSRFYDWGVPAYDAGMFTLNWVGAAEDDPECCSQYQMTSIGTIDAAGFHAKSTSGTHTETGEPLDLTG